MSSSSVTPEPGKAIYAAPDFVKWGQGASRNFSFLKHLGIGVTLGAGFGMLWKVSCGTGPLRDGQPESAPTLVRSLYLLVFLSS